MKKIILASSSPRRQEILRQIGLCYEVQVNEVDETIPAGMPPHQAVCELAYRKAWGIAQLEPGAIVIGADTIVVHGNRILGKPLDRSGAIETLRSLNGSDHLVITGFCVIEAATGKVVQANETTRVFFRRLTDAEIIAYVDSGEPMDKAGSYGIQGLGAVLIEKIDGCYFNVVGLPVSQLSQVLRSFGVKILS